MPTLNEIAKMNGEEIKRVRLALHLLQTMFGQLLDATAVTVCKWEHGHTSPSCYRTSLITMFAKVSAHDGVGSRVREMLVADSAVATMYFLLKTAFKRTSL